METSDNEYFERFFHDRAVAADDLHERGFRVEANIVATTAIDALAEVWLHDFPMERQVMDAEFRGRVSPAIRFTRFLKRFAAGAPHTQKVAVVMFADDMKRQAPTLRDLADTILAPRGGSLPGELPRAYLDISKHELLRTYPVIVEVPGLAALVEDYEYGALLYRFVRSPLVHFGSGSQRTHGFTQKDEVFYMPLERGLALGFGIGVVTSWLRTAATAYTTMCTNAGIRPATNLETGREGEDRLAARWERIGMP